MFVKTFFYINILLYSIVTRAVSFTIKGITSIGGDSNQTLGGENLVILASAVKELRHILLKPIYMGSSFENVDTRNPTVKTVRCLDIRDKLLINESIIFFLKNYQVTTSQHTRQGEE
jgi:hypothetical protein